MSGRISILSHFRWPLGWAAIVCLTLFVSPSLTQSALAQAVPAGVWPTGSPEDQPLPSQTLGTDLTLNQGVNAINAENASFDRFGLGLSAFGGGETNFLGTQTDGITAAYLQFSAEAGVSLRNSRTTYFGLYQPQYNLYPQYSEVNSFAQRFYQTLTHAISERSGVVWDVTAARYLSLNQYLPQSLAIGGIGIVVPTLGAQLQEDSFEVTNVATSIRYRYLMSTRLTFTGTLTSAYFMAVPDDVAGASEEISQRFITSGADLSLDYQLTARDSIGGEITPIYIYGLTPGGHELAETVQGVYQRQLGATWSARAAAGPLFVQESSPLFGGTQDTSYALNASINHSIRQSQLSVGYSRAFIVNLLTPGVVGNSVNFNTYVPVRSRWIATGSAAFAQDSGNSTYGTARVFGGSAQLAYQMQRQLQLYALYSLNSENFSSGATLQPYAYTRNQFGVGIRFNLGNPITSGGVQ